MGIIDDMEKMSDEDEAKAHITYFAEKNLRCTDEVLQLLRYLPKMLTDPNGDVVTKKIMLDDAVDYIKTLLLREF